MVMLPPVRALRHILLLSAVFLSEVYCTVIVTPQGCICPKQNYTCRAYYDVTGMSWSSEKIQGIAFTNIFPFDKKNVTVGGVQVLFSEDGRNLSSQLFVISLHDYNGENFTCSAHNAHTSVIACIIGPASPPTELALVWNSSTVSVSFQSPVYGGECVDYYEVTAVSGEQNLSCGYTELTYNCRIPPGKSANEYNFTVYGVTQGINGVLYNGNSSTDCWFPFPNVRIFEKDCGFLVKMQVSWNRSHMEPVTTTFSWRGVHSSGARHYERGSSEDSHLLTLDYSETGPVEIAVTFSSAVCNKTTVTHYLVEGVLTSVYLRSRTLVIESRDCIASPENYTLSIATPTALVNVSFNTTVEYDLEDVSPGDVITVQLVETTSNTIIDERNYTITYPTPTVTPTATPTETGVVRDVKQKSNSAVKEIAAGVVGGGVGLLVIVAVSVSLAVWLCVRKRRSIYDVRAASNKGEELKILGPQESVEERTCGPPETPAPAAPETDSTRPDVIPPVYDDLNTLSRKKEEPLSLPMYHVLEGPTPVVCAQDTHGTETPAPATDIPLYSVVDKSKKKKNRASKPITEDEEESSPINNEPQRDTEKDTSFQ